MKLEPKEPASAGTARVRSATGKLHARAGKSMTILIGKPGERDTLLSGLSKSARLKRATGTTASSSRSGLGAGYVMVPPLPSMDPLKRVLPDPVMPESRRICPGCDTHVEAIAGNCANCGKPYSFLPSMKAGDCIGNQYEIRGVMAFGAMGWIYLAWDQILSRWVVLKALMHAADAESMAMAVAERKYLAAVKHPNIVSVYNFARQGESGFIVMEYIGGKTVKELREERGVLPVAESIAYILRILPAFAYLHTHGMIYCDFKLENFMIEEAEVKLIDMGCVRRVEDTLSPVYGTRGYSAPESSQAPSVASDLYTIGRTLAIMVGGFDLFGDFEEKLPEAKSVPAFAKNPSLYAFLAKATHRDPWRRFQSADEMADQLLGVLREVTAGVGPGKPFESNYFFAAERGVITPADLAAFHKNPRAFLPELKPDAADAAATAITSAQNQTGEARLLALRAVLEKYPESTEAIRQIAALHISRGEHGVAERMIDESVVRDPYDWRQHWLRGVIALATGKLKEALELFETTAAELPGELAPRFALAMVAELLKDWSKAAHWYQVVAHVDPQVVSATLAYARCLRQVDDVEAAIEAYKGLPHNSQAYAVARVEMVRTLLQTTSRPPGLPQLKHAAETIEALRLEGNQGHQIRLELFLAALHALAGKAIQPSEDITLLGIPLQENPLRLAAEAAYRISARHALDLATRITLVNQANRTRPFSWL